LHGSQIICQVGPHLLLPRMQKKTYLIVRKALARIEYGERQGPFNLVYTDTIYEDGHVDWTVVGTLNGERIHRSGVNLGHGPIKDWDKLHRGRVASGWLLQWEPLKKERITQGFEDDKERHRVKRVESSADKTEVKPWSGLRKVG
jgi:hypothetical protein